MKKMKLDFGDWVEKPMLNCPNVPAPAEQIPSSGDTQPMNTDRGVAVQPSRSWQTLPETYGWTNLRPLQTSSGGGNPVSHA
jgi:hypothetical protein